MGPLKVICLTTGAFAQNGYIVGDPQSGEAVLVDPGEDAELFLRRLATERLVLKEVWLTHAHVDHVLGVRRVVEETGVPVYLHPDDLPLYRKAAEQAEWFGITADPPPEPDRQLADGDTLSVGEFTFEVRHLPGHSPGSVVFVGPGFALVGDVLFAGSVGRTDLPGGDARLLFSGIREKLLTLPDETVIYPGHGPETTIGRERTTNPFLTGDLHLV
ncbi:MAG: hydrolase [Gemmatimonadales bacterium]|nr:Hydroxyacylglutathione hydrolase GloC [bacterium HR33]GIW53475.1 MAG: hydrolase [Gemmatimonadales bacterium]